MKTRRQKRLPTTGDLWKAHHPPDMEVTAPQEPTVFFVVSGYHDQGPAVFRSPTGEIVSLYNKHIIRQLVKEGRLKLVQEAGEDHGSK